MGNIIKNPVIKLILMVSVALFYSGCGESKTEKDIHSSEKHEEHLDHGDSDGRDEENRETHVELSDEAIRLTGIKIEQVKMGHISKIIELAGEVSFNEDRVSHVVPRFPGIAREVHKRLGDYVNRDDVLASIESNESLSEYEIRSSICGTVVEKHVSIGEFIPEGTSIYMIADLSNVWVNLTVYTKDAQNIRIGQKVNIEAIGGNLTAQGHISYISPSYNNQTRSFIVRVVLPNPNSQWRPGTFVKGLISVGASKEVPVVSTGAVQMIDQKSKVFIPKSQNEFLPVDVELGESNEKLVHLKAGLKVGDRYVAAGAFELKAKMVTSALGGHAGHGH
ncbi:MAG: efflux RND transporter periplasmic adaptor subunit [bacterium]|nr:efflux RND transporter periplasmic adaptor subunit [bacterium]